MLSHVNNGEDEEKINFRSKPNSNKKSVALKILRRKSQIKNLGRLLVAAAFAFPRLPHSTSPG